MSSNVEFLFNNESLPLPAEKNLAYTNSLQLLLNLAIQISDEQEDYTDSEDVKQEQSIISRFDIAQQPVLINSSLYSLIQLYPV